MARRKVGNIFTYNVDSEEDYIDVWFMSDMHLGHRDFDLKEFKKYIVWVEEKPNRYIIGLGDYIECSTSSRAPGKALLSQMINVNGQVDELIKLLDPVKDRIIALTEGNHELRITLDTQFDVVAQAIAPRLQTHYLGYQGWLRLKRDRINYYMYLHHGPRKSSSQNPKYHLNIMALKLGYANQADLLAMGHNHKLFAHKYVTSVVSGDKLYTHECWGIRTGGFLNYPEYSQDSLYRPADVGSPILRFYLDKKKMHIYYDLEMYRDNNAGIE